MREKESVLICRQECGEEWNGMKLNAIYFLNAPYIKLHGLALEIPRNHSITAKGGNHCAVKLGMVSAKSHLPIEIIGLECWVRHVT